MVRSLSITSAAPFRLGLCLPCLVAICAGQLCATAVCAQGAAETARQEQARKPAQQKTPRHVYTEDDLKRAQILIPEDAERAQLARKNSAPAANPENSTALGAQSNEKQIAIGDAARKFREEKIARESESAVNKQPGFHLGLPATSLAAPKPPGGLDPVVPPRIASPKLPQIILWGSQSAPVAPRASPHGKRVSPFQPRPFVPASHKPLAAPRAPAVFPRATLPNIATLAPSPAAPKILAAARLRLQPSAKSTNAITVRAGDSLWKLARMYLGRGSAWMCIAQANPGIRSPERLRIGQELNIPSSCHP